MDAEQFKKAVHPLLKAHGFKKSSATWRKHQAESIAVFNIQKSQWGEGFYVNIGMYFGALGKDRVPTENKCHVQTRLEATDPSKVVTMALRWFNRRATLRGARQLAESDSKKGLVFWGLRETPVT